MQIDRLISKAHVECVIAWSARSSDLGPSTYGAKRPTTAFNLKKWFKTTKSDIIKEKKIMNFFLSDFGR